MHAKFFLSYQIHSNSVTTCGQVLNGTTFADNTDPDLYQHLCTTVKCCITQQKVTSQMLS